jgi:hypothetical protein
MIAALFAVAMLGGGEMPILHAQQFAEAHAFVHSHMDDSLGGAHRHATVTQADATPGNHQHADHQDGDHKPDTDRGCTHVHAHCCAAIAILATATSTPLAGDAGQLRFDPNGAVPYGQLSHPPLRPPRLVA